MAATYCWMAGLNARNCCSAFVFDLDVGEARIIMTNAKEGD